MDETLTWEELAEKIAALTPEQRKETATVFHQDTGDNLKVRRLDSSEDWNGMPGHTIVTEW